MGDPKKNHKKYQTASHPWIRADIELQRTLRQEYGLTTRKEVLIAQSFLKKYKAIAKSLIAHKSVQAQKEKEQVLSKLQRLGLLNTGSTLDQIFSLTLRDILNRRIQSIVAKKGLARSMKQARQFIVHRHILIAGKEITSPSYLIQTSEEVLLSFKPTSSLASEDHPERLNFAKEIHEEAEQVKKTPTKKKKSASEDATEKPENSGEIKNNESTNE